MKESGWDIKVRNIVFMYLMTHKPPPHPITPPETLKEPMSFIRNAQVSILNHFMIAEYFLHTYILKYLCNTYIILKDGQGWPC